MFRVRFGGSVGYYTAIQGSALPGLVIRSDDDSVWVSVDQRFVDAVGTTMAEGASGISGFSGRIPATARTESLAPFLIRD